MSELKNLVKDMELLSIPLNLKDEIVSSLEESKTMARKLFYYKLLAPIALLFIVPFLKWEDEKTTDIFNNSKLWRWLGKKFPSLYDIVDRFDNNASINGDGLEWVEDPVNGVDYRGIKYSHKRFPLENTKEIRKQCYYTAGIFHRRSKIARYIWLGIRNKASKYALLLGPTLDRSVKIDEYKYADDKGTTIEFYRTGHIWQYTTQRTKGILKFRANLGYKLNNYETDLEHQVMVTYKTFDLVGNKIYIAANRKKILIISLLLDLIIVALIVYYYMN